VGRTRECGAQTSTNLTSITSLCEEVILTWLPRRRLRRRRARRRRPRRRRSNRFSGPGTSWGARWLTPAAPRLSRSSRFFKVMRVARSLLSAALAARRGDTW